MVVSRFPADVFATDKPWRDLQNLGHNFLPTIPVSFGSCPYARWAKLAYQVMLRLITFFLLWSISFRLNILICHLSQLMRLWYLSHRRPAKAQASLHIRAVSPEPLLFAHMEYGNRRRVRPQIRHLAPMDGCACAFEEWVYGGWEVP